MPSDTGFSAADSLSVVVTEHWLDQFCEQVGSLCAVLQALSKLDDHRPHTLVSEALDNCASLQDLLNVIPVWGGHVPAATSLAGPVPHVRPTRFVETVTDYDDETAAAEFGDCYPEIGANEADHLPAIDRDSLHERCGADAAHLLNVLQRFCRRTDGDLRELELLSVGHDWTRLSRLAGALKDSAAQASAARIVVDAAALQGAARVGCRNDVDLALDALRADFRACARQVEEWLTTGAVG